MAGPVEELADRPGELSWRQALEGGDPAAEPATGDRRGALRSELADRGHARDRGDAGARPRGRHRSRRGPPAQLDRRGDAEPGGTTERPRWRHGRGCAQHFRRHPAAGVGCALGAPDRPHHDRSRRRSDADRRLRPGDRPAEPDLGDFRRAVRRPRGRFRHPPRDALSGGVRRRGRPSSGGGRCHQLGRRSNLVKRALRRIRLSRLHPYGLSGTGRARRHLRSRHGDRAADESHPAARAARSGAALRPRATARQAAAPAGNPAPSAPGGRRRRAGRAALVDGAAGTHVRLQSAQSEGSAQRIGPHLSGARGRPRDLTGRGGGARGQPGPGRRAGCRADRPRRGRAGGHARTSCLRRRTRSSP